MIYRKEELVKEDTEDEQFPVKQIDHLTALEGGDERYIGRATLNMQTPVGAQQVPISFEIEADSIQDAFEKYRDAAEPKIEEVRGRLKERLQQMQRQMQQQRQQEQGRIVTPESGQMAGDIVNFDELRGEE
ncbi:MAG: hypothetical protein ACOC7T_04905 [Planctomycetota bacterium]